MSLDRRNIGLIGIIGGSKAYQAALDADAIQREAERRRRAEAKRTGSSTSKLILPLGVKLNP